MKFLHLINVFLFLLTACVSSPKSSLGIQEAYKSYIPAKTAVLGCQFWPETSNFPAHPQTNVLGQERETFCATVDDSVLEAFKDQTFMRGYTPKAVMKSLGQSGKVPLLAEIPGHWRLDAGKAKNCSDIPSYYNAVVRERLEWRAWLQSLSEATHHSDAVLIPFVAFAREEKENDRGLLLAKRAVSVVLLLVDMESADLIWVGKRQSFLSQHRLADKSVLKYPEFPEWAGVMQEVLIDTLWREYPGKIFF